MYLLNDHGCAIGADLWCLGVNQHLLEVNLVLLMRGWVRWPLRRGVVP